MWSPPAPVVCEIVTMLVFAISSFPGVAQPAMRATELLRAALKDQEPTDVGHDMHAACRSRDPGGAAQSNASHAARCVACHGVRSHPVPVALVGECSIQWPDIAASIALGKRFSKSKIATHSGFTTMRAIWENIAATCVTHARPCSEPK